MTGDTSGDLHAWPGPPHPGRPGARPAARLSRATRCVLAVCVAVAVVHVLSAGVAAQEPGTALPGWQQDSALPASGVVVDGTAEVAAPSSASRVPTWPEPLRAALDAESALRDPVSDVLLTPSFVADQEAQGRRRLSVVGGVVGFVVGAAAGGLVGCAMNRDSYGVFCGGQNDTKVVVSAAVGGIAGAAAGALIFARRE